jgi:hypothetical protein
MYCHRRESRRSDCCAAEDLVHRLAYSGDVAAGQLAVFSRRERCVLAFAPETMSPK